MNLLYILLTTTQTQTFPSQNNSSDFPGKLLAPKCRNKKHTHTNCTGNGSFFPHPQACNCIKRLKAHSKVRFQICVFEMLKTCRSPGQDHKLINLLVGWGPRAIPNQLFELLQLSRVQIRCRTPNRPPPIAFKEHFVMLTKSQIIREVQSLSLNSLIQLINGFPKAIHIPQQ